MIDHPFLEELCSPTNSKIILLVVDGLGGLPRPETGKSELEEAYTPNLDDLAVRSACGLTVPVGPGIIPGSGPGHLALFGYDPLKYAIGRGVLEALGIGIDLGPNDIAVRCNFCTVDDAGRLIDRRAERIRSSESEPLVDQLAGITMEGAELLVEPVQDYRFVVVFKAEGLGQEVSDTDPQRLGVQPLNPVGTDQPSNMTARLAAQFIDTARNMLGSRQTANMILMRGFSKIPAWPQFAPSYKLDPCAVAAYPMYRGLAGLVGMKVVPTGHDFDAELDTVEEHIREHDFVFLHYKPADTAGEDGNFDAKVVALEELDRRIPRLLGLGADVVAVAGDHSTPSVLAAHSWHPVPLLINSEFTAGVGSDGFTERSCARGHLGTQPATSLMFHLLAHAGKLKKYGA